MNAIDDLINKYYALKPAQYGFLERFNLYREIYKDSCSAFILELQMRSSQLFQEKKRLHLTFSEVKELKIGDLEGLLNFLIEIRSAREYQWEDINFKVIESEYQAFSFLCSKIEVKVE